MITQHDYFDAAIQIIDIYREFGRVAPEDLNLMLKHNETYPEIFNWAMKEIGELEEAI